MINFDAIGSGPKIPAVEPSVPLKSDENVSGNENSFKEMLRDINEVDSSEIVLSDDNTSGDTNFDEDVEENKSGLRILKLLKGEQLPFNTKERPDNVIYSFKDLLPKKETTKININESFVSSEVLGDTGVEEDNQVGETDENAPVIKEQEPEKLELPKAKSPDLFAVLEKSVKYLPDNVKSRVSNFIEKNSSENIVKMEIPDSGPDEKINEAQPVNESQPVDVSIKSINDNNPVKAPKLAEIIAKPEKEPEKNEIVIKDNKTSEKPLKLTNNIGNNSEQKNEIKEQKPPVTNNRISSLSPVIHNNIVRLLNNNVFNKRLNQQEPENIKENSKPVITDLVQDTETTNIPVLNADEPKDDTKTLNVPVNKPVTAQNQDTAKPLNNAPIRVIIEKNNVIVQPNHIFKQTPKIFNEQINNVPVPVVKTNDTGKPILLNTKENKPLNNKNPELPVENKPVYESSSVTESPVEIPVIKNSVSEIKAPAVEVKNDTPANQVNLNRSITENEPINKEIIPDKKENTFLNIDKIRFSYSTYYKPEPAIISRISGTISAKSFLERIVENLKKYEPAINYKSVSFSPGFKNFFVPQKKNTAATTENTNTIKNKTFIFSPENKVEIEVPTTNIPLHQADLIIPPIEVKVEKEIEKIAPKVTNQQIKKDSKNNYEPEIFGDHYSNDQQSDNKVTLTSFEVDYDPEVNTKGAVEPVAVKKSEKARIQLDDPSLLPALLSSSQIIKLINDGVPMHFSIIPEVIKEIAVNAAKLNQNITLNINLNPIDLGEINMMIKLTDGKQMTVMFETSSARAQSMVESYFSNIKNIIKDNSFVVHEITANIATAGAGIKPVTPRERNNSSGGFSSNSSDSEHSPGQSRRKRRKGSSDNGESEELKVDI
jgi:hypothetical protein